MGAAGPLQMPGGHPVMPRTTVTDQWQFRGGSVVATDAARAAAQAGYKTAKHAITCRKDICK
jgi:hypothetical protein